MRQLRAWFLRLGGLFDSAHREKDLAAEMASNLQLHIEDNLRAGISPAEAHRQALNNRGGVEQPKDISPHRAGLPLLKTLSQDFLFSSRMPRKNPCSPAVAPLPLSLGIGANTAIFS